MNKNITTIALAIFFAAMLLWWISLPSKTATITISENASAKQIAESLYKINAISSKTAFRAVVKLSGLSRKLKAGTYIIPARTSIFGIVRMISSGKGAYARVTIPEGFTAAEAAEALSSRGVVDKEKFLQLIKDKELEGYLYPDTYFFDRNSNEQVVADKMLNEFDKNFTAEMEKRADELKMGKKKIVILASIIEKEAVRSNERPLIAGVFYNRLKKGWFLESCATVQYSLGGHKPALTYKDTKVNSPYNTYKCYGLPPGPICSPGKESINAALYPAQTEDMFFVAAGSGTHVFSQYFSEHINNKIKQKKARKKLLTTPRQ